MDNQDALRQIIQLISKVYGDTSKTPQQTKEMLEDIITECEDRINALGI